MSGVKTSQIIMGAEIMGSAKLICHYNSSRGHLTHKVTPYKGEFHHLLSSVLDNYA